MKFDICLKNCREKSGLFKIGQENRLIYMTTNVRFFIISSSVLLRLKNLSDGVIRKIKTRILDVIAFFFFENRVFYEIMWKNMVERGRTQVTIWSMCIACWIPMAIHKQSQVILIAFPLQLGHVNALQCYVIRKLRVHFYINVAGSLIYGSYGYVECLNVTDGFYCVDVCSVQLLVKLCLF
jgi:hypothetical protein